MSIDNLPFLLNILPRAWFHTQRTVYRDNHGYNNWDVCEIFEMGLHHWEVAPYYYPSTQKTRLNRHHWRWPGLSWCHQGQNRCTQDQKNERWGVLWIRWIAGWRLLSYWRTGTGDVEVPQADPKELHQLRKGVANWEADSTPLGHANRNRQGPHRGARWDRKCAVNWGCDWDWKWRTVRWVCCQGIAGTHQADWRRNRSRSHEDSSQ